MYSKDEIETRILRQETGGAALGQALDIEDEGGIHKGTRGRESRTRVRETGIRTIEGVGRIEESNTLQNRRVQVSEALRR